MFLLPFFLIRNINTIEIMNKIVELNPDFSVGVSTKLLDVGISTYGFKGVRIYVTFVSIESVSIFSIGTRT